MGINRVIGYAVYGNKCDGKGMVRLRKKVYATPQEGMERNPTGNKLTNVTAIAVRK